MFRKNHLAAAAALTLFAASAAMAAVSADEAKLLGGDTLTAFGAEKAGNKEGTIPAYSGKAPKAPASYDRKDPGQRPDPYNDKPLFTITAQNAAQYAGKLDAMLEVFKKYPTFRMDVYPTHRDYEFPKHVLDNSIRNATSCKGASNELKLEGCYGGVPFPIPKTGNQVMWNHLLYYGGYLVSGASESTITPADGKGILQNRNSVVQQYDYFDPKNTKPNPTDLMYWKAAITSTAPAREAGNVILLLDNLDSVDKGRRAYQYVPGQRRIKLSPNLAYDTPNPLTGGTAVMDDAKGFLGALDRYDFKLLGKKEKFIMYNNFNTTNNKACNLEKIIDHKNFPNPECIRWELHRVWQVEATVKPGVRHVYPKRVFYWDEDVAGAGSTEAYDAAGKIYRVTNVASYPFYEGETGGYADATFTLDLQTGAWITNGISSTSGFGWTSSNTAADPRSFSPDAIGGSGIR